MDDGLKACQNPPEGWWCSREAGHEGPCAARRTDGPSIEEEIVALRAELDGLYRRKVPDNLPKKRPGVLGENGASIISRLQHIDHLQRFQIACLERELALTRTPEAPQSVLVEKLCDLHTRMTAAIKAKRPYPVRMEMGKDDAGTVLSAAVELERNRLSAAPQSEPQPREAMIEAAKAALFRHKIVDTFSVKAALSAAMRAAAVGGEG